MRAEKKADPDPESVSSQETATQNKQDTAPSQEPAEVTPQIPAASQQSAAQPPQPTATQPPQASDAPAGNDGSSDSGEAAAQKVKLPLPSANRGRRMRMVLVLCVVLLALLAYAVYWVVWLRHTVTTDDAYVDARIVSVSSRLPGRVAGVPVKEGDTVKKGQLLVQLTRSQMLIRMNQTKAEVDNAVAKVNELRAGAREEEVRIARTEIRLRMVELEKRRDLLKRLMGLARIKAVTEQELEQQRANVKLGEVELEMGNDKLALLLAGNRKEAIAQADADLALARGKLADVVADLSDLAITSPIDGVVARRMVDPGEFVEDGQGLMQIVETGRTWVVANLEEVDIEEVHAGQSVEVEVDAYSGITVKGRVQSIYSATLSRFSILSTTSTSGSFIKVTQRIPVRIEWAQDDFPPMYPGLNVVVHIDVRKE
jgi:multidrug resistance efflux pump